MPTPSPWPVSAPRAPHAARLHLKPCVQERAGRRAWALARGRLQVKVGVCFFALLRSTHPAAPGVGAFEVGGRGGHPALPTGQRSGAFLAQSCRQRAAGRTATNKSGRGSAGRTGFVSVRSPQVAPVTAGSGRLSVPANTYKQRNRWAPRPAARAHLPVRLHLTSGRRLALIPRVPLFTDTDMRDFHSTLFGSGADWPHRGRQEHIQAWIP